MTRWHVLLLLFLVASVFVGCSMIRTAPPQQEEEDQEEEQVQPSQATPTPARRRTEPPVVTNPPDLASTAAPWTGTPAELYEKTQQMFIRGVELTQAEKFEEALEVYHTIMRLLLRPYNRELDPETTRKLDSLYYEVCLAQVRLGRLTGRFAPVVIKRKLIGIDFNPEVERWVRYYSINARETMQQYLSRSTRYLPMIRQILKDEGLPDDLAYLPLIESGYSSYAYSPAAAVGIWQFIRDTGSRYGLTINEWVDERRDPYKASRAAARLLKDLYGDYGDWALALAAYNCGSGCVNNAISNAGHRDYWRLNLPAETKAYVPKYFASVLIARDPETFGMYLVPEKPLVLKQIDLQGVVELKRFAELVNMSYEELKALNPELLGSYTPPNVSHYLINVPAERYEEIAKNVAELNPADLYLQPQQIASLSRPVQPRSSGGGGGGRMVYYKVKRGDTLGGIARRHGTTVAVLKKYNPAARASVLRPGTILKIPKSGGSSQSRGRAKKRRHR